jgi:hypothetical protein
MILIVTAVFPQEPVVSANLSFDIAGELAKKKRFPAINIEFWDAPLELVPELQSQASVLLFTLKKGLGKTASPSKLPAYMFSKKPGTKFSANSQLTPIAGCINS